MAALTQKPLDGLEIHLLNPDTKILRYTELYNYANIEEVFGRGSKVIILYLIQNQNSGHWVCLFKNKKGINFFDSYGVRPDYELEMLSNTQRQNLNEQQDYLRYLLRGKHVTYNNITYQKDHTATCGCFVTHRLHNSNLNDLEYFNIFYKNNYDPDIFVAQYCHNLLN